MMMVVGALLLLLYHPVPQFGHRVTAVHPTTTTSTTVVVGRSRMSGAVSLWRQCTVTVSPVTHGSIMLLLLLGWWWVVVVSGVVDGGAHLGWWGRPHPTGALMGPLRRAGGGVRAHRG